VRRKFHGTNDGDRYVSERDETRPMGVGQASLVGRVGRSFEWGADGRTWNSSSTETWVFSTSSAKRSTSCALRSGGNPAV